MTSTRRRKYPWGTLYIRADWGQASASIEYAIDDAERWRLTPFQVADCRHRWATGMLMVNRWLAGETGGAA